ncbi:MAG TPA: heavy metal-binding domain-containing protein [Roseiarcus sp.]|nr:heavy metal-binding domain-containing protein [Roseiarcus sp.]
MQVSFSSGLDDGRATTAIGRVKAAARWRAADQPHSEAERQAAIEALKREAAEYGADAIVDVRFEVDDVRAVDIDSVALQRVAVTGLAVRFARAA